MNFPAENLENIYNSGLQKWKAKLVFGEVGGLGRGGGGMHRCQPQKFEKRETCI